MIRGLLSPTVRCAFVVGLTIFTLGWRAEAAAPKLAEHFENNENGWAIGDDHRRSLRIDGGRYVVTHKRSEGAWATWHAGVADGGDFRLVANVEKLAGTDTHGFGLLFGGRDDANRQSFVVSADGHFRYGVFSGGRFDNITGWQASDAIKRGDGAKNEIEVARFGNRLVFSVNKKKVSEAIAKPFAGDKIGIEVNHEMSIAVDDLFVYANPAAEPTVGVVGPRTDRVIAVFDVVDASGKTDDGVRAELTEYLVAKLAQRSSYAVVPRAQLRGKLKASKAESYDACYEQACQIELGKAAAANAILTTRIMRVDEKCVLTSTLFDLQRETTVHAAVTERSSCSASNLFSGLDQIASEL